MEEVVNKHEYLLDVIINKYYKLNGNEEGIFRHFNMPFVDLKCYFVNGKIEGKLYVYDDVGKYVSVLEFVNGEIVCDDYYELEHENKWCNVNFFGAYDGIINSFNMETDEYDHSCFIMTKKFTVTENNNNYNILCPNVLNGRRVYNRESENVYFEYNNGYMKERIMCNGDSKSREIYMETPLHHGICILSFSNNVRFKVCNGVDVCDGKCYVQDTNELDIEIEKVNGMVYGEMYCYNSKYRSRCEFDVEGENIQKVMNIIHINYYYTDIFMIMKNGDFKMFHDNEKEMLTCSFINGQLEGSFKMYDEQGHKIQHYIYKLNEIVRCIIGEDMNKLYRKLSNEVMFNDKRSVKDDEYCYICRFDEKLIELNCHHIYHMKCLNIWFKNTKQKDYQLCPMCNKLIDWNNCKSITKE
jgi:antitoxin component YwqK of YwqJK toxin-antitoxin module